MLGHLVYKLYNRRPAFSHFVDEGLVPGEVKGPKSTKTPVTEPGSCQPSDCPVGSLFILPPTPAVRTAIELIFFSINYKKQLPIEVAL